MMRIIRENNVVTADVGISIPSDGGRIEPRLLALGLGTKT
jgi:hypothetical protein